MDVRDHELEYASTERGDRLRHIRSMLLPRNTWLADGIRSSLGLDDKSLDHVLANKLLDGTNIEVSEAAVPEREVHRAGAEEVGKLRRRHGAAIQETDIPRADTRSEEQRTRATKVYPVLLEQNRVVLLVCEIRDREEVVAQGRDVEDAGELDRLPLDTITLNRLKADVTNTHGIDDRVVGKTDGNASRSVGGEPVPVRGHMSSGT